MQFTTPITIAKQQSISYNSQYLLMGSCFAETIGNKLKEHLFSGIINPFGILYNPFSIANALERMIQRKEFMPNDLIQHNGLYHSLMHHGKFSNADATTTLQQINEAFIAAADALTKISHLFITFGSSWVYECEGVIVANCHKLPQQQFVQRRLSVNEVVERWKHLLATLHNINPELEVVFTVSPVRYFEHGSLATHTNKAVLLLAVEALYEQCEQAHYFPAYELIFDELRDYRYYDESLTHPSRIAVEYIWERFCDTYFTPQTLTLAAEAKKVSNRLQHRPLHRDDTEYQRFVNATSDAINAFVAHLRQNKINSTIIEDINNRLINDLNKQ